MILLVKAVAYVRSLMKPHEWPAFVVSFAYFFCLLAAYYIIRPVRDQFSAAVGSTQLPLFYLATFTVTLSLTPVFGALAARFKRRQFVVAVYGFFLLCAIGFVPLYQMQDLIGAKVLGTVFFVWVSVFNLLVVALFWSFMADIYDREQARRLFPLIAMGGAFGAIAGPVLTKALVFVFGVSGLLLVSAALLGVCMAGVFYLSGWSRRHPVPGEPDRNERVIGGSMLAGASVTLRTPFLRQVALLMLLGDCVGTVVYAFVTDYSKATYLTPEARINFSSSLDFATNVLQILFQFLLTRKILLRLGPSATLALDGLVKAAMLGVFAVFGGTSIVLVAVISRASAYGIFKPAADTLYTDVDAEVRYKAKNFIDTSVWRFGDVVVNGGLNLLRGLGMSVPGLALLTAGAGLASAWVGRRIASPEKAPASAARE